MDVGYALGPNNGGLSDISATMLDRARQGFGFNVRRIAVRGKLVEGILIGRSCSWDIVVAPSAGAKFAALPPGRPAGADDSVALAESYPPQTYVTDAYNRLNGIGVL